MTEVDPNTRNPREILEEKLREKGYTYEERVVPTTNRSGQQTGTHTASFAVRGDEAVHLGVPEAILPHLQHFLKNSTAFNNL